MLKTVVSRGVPVAAVIGGGYSRDIDKLALRHSIMHRAAVQVKEAQLLKQMLPNDPFKYGNNDIGLLLMNLVPLPVFPPEPGAKFCFGAVVLPLQKKSPWLRSSIF